MILYVNENNEVKDVNITNNEKLIALSVNDDDKNFKGWSIAKICCHKVEVKDGYITSYTPYVDDKIIEHIDQLGQQNTKAQAKIDYLSMMTGVEM